MTTALVLLVLALATSALFSGAETGFYLCSRMRLHLEWEEGRRSAHRLQAMIDHPSLLLAVLLVGNNLALELVTFATQDLMAWLGGLSPEARATLGAVLSTPIVFLVAEAGPKNAFMRRPDELLTLVSLPLAVLYRVLWPLGWLLTRATAVLEHWVRIAKPAGPRPDEMRLHRVLRAGVQEGLLTRTEHLLAAKVLTLRSVTARDLAGSPQRLPRLELPADPARWREVVARSKGSRALVYEPSGRLAGVVHAVDLALALDAGRTDLESLVRPLPRVAPDLPLGALLEILARSGVPLAAVEPAPVARGLVRSRDLVHAILGPAPSQEVRQPNP